jgi:hypothetical protein
MIVLFLSLVGEIVEDDVRSHQLSRRTCRQRKRNAHVLPRHPVPGAVPLNLVVQPVRVAAVNGVGAPWLQRLWWICCHAA